MGRSGLLVVVLLASFVGTACVTYVPVELAAVGPQEEVRVRLTEDAAVRLAREFGRIRELLEGSVEPRGPDSMMVSLWIGRDYAGTPFENVRQTVVFGRRDVSELRRRRLSVWRSAFASAAVTAAFAVAIDRIFLQEDPNPPPQDNTEPPPGALFPVFRIPIH